MNGNYSDCNNFLSLFIVQTKQKNKYIQFIILMLIYTIFKGSGALHPLLFLGGGCIHEDTSR